MEPDHSQTQQVPLYPVAFARPTDLPTTLEFIVSYGRTFVRGRDGRWYLCDETPPD